MDNSKRDIPVPPRIDKRDETEDYLLDTDRSALDTDRSVGLLLPYGAGDRQPPGARDPPEEELEQQEIDIPEDIYGAAILSIVRDIHVVQSGEWRDEEVQLCLVQATFSLLLLVVNLGMQFSLLFFIYTYVVAPSVHVVQDQYTQFHAQVFDADGIFLPELWSEYDGRESLCILGMSNHQFYSMVIFLWVLLIVREFRTTERLFRDFLLMPTCSNNLGMCEQKGSSCRVVALTSTTRAVLVVVIIVPKVVICITLMMLGCQWLTATTSFTDLVMNSIAMEFVTNIDEALYISILPVSHRKLAADINFVVWKKRTSSLSNEFRAFQRSAAYLIVSVGFVICYSGFLQNVLPPDLTDLAEQCEVYHRSHRTAQCEASWWRGSFGMSKCFPYGTSLGD
ncbi:unnamed protein product [Polarella glacialis]|uniref:Uncharacterized protein n=1 Tax=Polarella glacialis TaxID=89957 RepID=A0A813GKU5_POLGL|nr:unnamed protein product [Polarella glacialis]CAE8689446.1 unnamed protein product [Polarella glacialis]